MLIINVSETYNTLKKVILNREDLTNQQCLDQLFYNIELQYDSATEMLLCMREVIGQWTFDDGLFAQLLCKQP